jgi:ketosteroid isomerase-like protein
MSEENVEIVRRSLEAWNCGDIKAAVACADPGIEVREDPTLPDGEVFHGVEGILASVAKGAEVLGEVRYEPEEFLDLGDRVLIVLRLIGRGTHSGAPVDQRICQLWTLCNERVVCLESFFLLAHALEAAGLSEDGYGSWLEPRS